MIYLIVNISVYLLDLDEDPSEMTAISYFEVFRVNFSKIVQIKKLSFLNEMMF